MRNYILFSALVGAIAGQASTATAHAIAGNRFFPTTLAIDDPGVADELSFPTVSSFKTGDSPGARQLDVSGEYSKRLTDKLGVSVGETWTRIKTPGADTVRGFQNVETTLKYQFHTSAEHESIMATALSVEWSGTGADQIGAEHHSTISPSFFFGKGAGDLPDAYAWARPFAVTGQVSYAIPSRSHDGPDANSQALSYGLALQYSIPYLQAHVKDYGLSEFVGRLTPVIEAAFETPTTYIRGAKTTGTINPGLIWSGRHFQVAAEAVLPINRDSGHGTGFVMQVHFFLDDLFPTSIGKPIW